MPLGDVYRMRTCCYTPAQISLNITYWQVMTTIPPEPSVGAIAQFAEEELAPVYKAWMPTSANWRGCGWQRQNGIPPPEVASTLLAGPGLGTALLTPTQSSGLIAWQTQRTGYRWRGRIYPGFVDAGLVNADGSLKPGGQTLLDQIRQAYNLGFQIGTEGDPGYMVLQLMLRTEVLPKTLPPTYLYSIVTNTLTRDAIATQRRRGQFGRKNVLPF